MPVRLPPPPLPPCRYPSPDPPVRRGRRRRRPGGRRPQAAHRLRGAGGGPGRRPGGAVRPPEGPPASVHGTRPDPAAGGAAADGRRGTAREMLSFYAGPCSPQLVKQFPQRVFLFRNPNEILHIFIFIVSDFHVYYIHVFIYYIHFHIYYICT